MKLKDYLYSKAIYMYLGIAIVLYLNLTLWIMGISAAYLFLITLGLIFIVAAFLVVGWIKVSRRIKELNSRLNALQDKYLIAETLDKPRDASELAFYTMTKAISRSAIETVERAKREKEEYADFVDSWVHEIKTPLTACNLIVTNGCDETKLKREIKKADNLTDVILYYARLRSINKDTQIAECSLKSIADSAIMDQKTILIASGISIQTQGDSTVYTDSKLFGFIIKQLLINSAKYCQGCEIKLDITSGRFVYEDNGIGIPSHELTRVTERGFTGARFRSEKGTGMGLYIVSELCKQLGITLSIESEEGKFTRFTFDF